MSVSIFKDIKDCDALDIRDNSDVIFNKIEKFKNCCF